MKTLPVFIQPAEIMGTVFFYDHQGEIYCVTNRHNVAQHTVNYDDPDGGGTIAKNGVKETWSFLSIKKLHRNRRNPRKKAVQNATIGRLNLNQATIYEQENLDIAVLEIDDFEPRQHGCDVFSETTHVNPGDSIDTEACHHQRTEDPRKITRETASGKVIEVDRIDFGAGAKYATDLGIDLSPGSSGSPVSKNNKLVGVYSARYGKSDPPLSVYLQAEKIKELIP